MPRRAQCVSLASLICQILAMRAVSQPEPILICLKTSVLNQTQITTNCDDVFYIKITMWSILISSFFQKPASSRLAETVTTIWVSHAIVWKASFGTIHHLTYKKWQKCQNVRFITLYIPEPQNRNWQQTKIIKAETPLNIVSLQLENENSTAASDRS